MRIMCRRNRSDVKDPGRTTVGLFHDFTHSDTLLTAVYLNLRTLPPSMLKNYLYFAQQNTPHYVCMFIMNLSLLGSLVSEAVEVVHSSHSLTNIYIVKHHKVRVALIGQRSAMGSMLDDSVAKRVLEDRTTVYGEIEHTS